MKKKTYMKPQTEAMEIQMESMIALSDPGFGGGGNGGGDAPAMPDFGEEDIDFSNINLW